MRGNAWEMHPFFSCISVMLDRRHWPQLWQARRKLAAERLAPAPLDRPYDKDNAVKRHLPNWPTGEAPA